MPGVWKKTLTYLGLVEDEEYDELDEVAAQPRQAEVRSIQRPQPVREVMVGDRSEGIVRTIPSSRPSTASAIHKPDPRRFNEAPAHPVAWLTPANMGVSAQDLDRIAGAGIYNQFCPRPAWPPPR